MVREDFGEGVGWKLVVNKLNHRVVVLVVRGGCYKEVGVARGAWAGGKKEITFFPPLGCIYPWWGGFALLGDNYAAIADYTKAIELNPQFAAAYTNRGYAKNNLGDKEGAIADYTKAIELNPQDASSYLNRGYAKSRLGDTKGAIFDFTKAIEFNPQFAEAYYNRAIVYGQEGRKH
ncbi:MAG: tetratricopeptide repeat protein [Ignavibacteria bacterium]|nr:tetratricopeptide repeat protein [Ignavibacteria bacterium]